MDKEKQYVITDGESYIAQINSEFTKVKYKSKAKQYSAGKADNVIKDLPRLLRKSIWTKEEIENNDKEENDFKNTLKELKDMDDRCRDFDDLEFRGDDNWHTYGHKTILEDENFDFRYFVGEAIKVFSQLDTYVENMAYNEREIDLELLDIRHYERDLGTKLNAIEAQALTYYTQEKERQRIECKRNKTLGKILLTDLNRLKNEDYLKITDKIMDSEYRYRRLNKEKINEILHTKRANSKLKAVI